MSWVVLRLLSALVCCVLRFNRLGFALAHFALLCVMLLARAQDWPHPPKVATYIPRVLCTLSIPCFLLSRLCWPAGSAYERAYISVETDRTRLRGTFSPFHGARVFLAVH